MSMVQSQTEKSSPMMQQWSMCKQQSHGSLLLFRMGDFYEAFHEDAVRLASELSVTLTQRQGIPMAGVPVASLDSALEKLSIRGLCVAVAEQTEDPKKAKGLVERQVVRIITPGTYTPNHDSGKCHTWVVSMTHSHQLAIAACDISTGEMGTCSFDTLNELEAELCRLRPREIILDAKTLDTHPTLRELCDSLSCFISPVDYSVFDIHRAEKRLQEHFHIHSTDSLGLKDLPSCIRCIGALMSYLKDHLKLSLESLRSIYIFPKEDIMHIDRSSQKNLEIIQPLFEGHWHNTLLHHLDKTQTPMGSRLLRDWLCRPLKNAHKISERASAVEQILEKPTLLSQFRKALSQVRDLKRLSAKVICQTASARDLAALRSSLQALPQLQYYLNSLNRGLWSSINRRLQPQPEALAMLEQALCEEPAARIGEGPIIREGYQNSLDELRSIRQDGQNWVGIYQAQLKENFGIKNLKVGYTPAFGYYIEVSKAQASLMPSHFTRRQTLVGSERFISPELKNFEDKVLHAQERMESLERQLLDELIQKLKVYCPQLDQASQAIAEADCLLALAEVAHCYRYIRPKVDESDELSIVGGRHPIVEQMIGADQFIANDTQMGVNHGRMMILTGPNMAGKSTYIRQVALLVLMAQIGSFVPAKSMHLGLIDRIFTRVGASDDLARGQSTFMVEMSETASILHHATDRSLVILDEVGRGTSTYDGIAIARSIAEFLLSQPGHQPKTLFATHYSELTDLPQYFPQARNYQVMVREWKDDIIFLHQIAQGCADRSYGIYVAKLAGLPTSVISRARAIQAQLESPKGRQTRQTKSSDQLELFSLQTSVTPAKDRRIEIFEKKFSELNINEITPLQALVVLEDLVSVWKTQHGS